jgi:hypothetical protein
MATSFMASVRRKSENGSNGKTRPAASLAGTIIPPRESRYKLYQRLRVGRLSERYATGSPGKSASSFKKAFCMKRNLVLPVTSLLSILFASFHLVDDIVYGSEKGLASNLLIVAILAVWLYGTIMLPERRAGYIIMLLGSLLGLTIFVTHVTGAGGLAGIEIGKLSGAFFFVWTLVALAVVSLLSLTVSALGLWNLLRSKAP